MKVEICMYSFKVVRLCRREVYFSECGINLRATFGSLDRLHWDLRCKADNCCTFVFKSFCATLISITMQLLLYFIREICWIILINTSIKRNRRRTMLRCNLFAVYINFAENFSSLYLIVQQYLQIERITRLCSIGSWPWTLVVHSL